MRGFRTFALVVAAVIALVVVVRRTWFGVREADARVEVADLTPRSSRVLTQVLDVARRPELPKLEDHPDLEVDDFVITSDPEGSQHITIAFRDMEDSDGLTVEQRWEGTVAELEDRLAPGHGAFQGRVRDKHTGEDLAGVTIVATSSGLPGAQTAISDEHGFFAIGDLPAGEYLLTFYYLETTIERSGMRIEPRQATPAFQAIEQAPPRVFVWRHEEVIDTDPDEDPDPEFEDPDTGFSFSCVTSLENTYVIE